MPLSLSPTAFRSAVVVAVVAYALSYLAPVLGMVSVDPEFQDALSWSYFGSAIPYNALQVWFVLWGISTSIGLAGLAFFWGPARWILVATILLSLATQPFFGVGVYTPYDALGTLAGTITLWLTTVSLWSPLANRFDKQPSLRVS